ncbi:MAG: hypothetical protein B6244_01915 [Candidatus Cloacimonetes bacterium 4572_55]|nr:MAG: hypothetical protein B6244_01915 [Candidatus Cloacimonetes bacterium 4572_55]
MRKSSILLSVLIIFLCIGIVHAENKRIGVVGALELRLPVGGRATALGGAVLADVTGTEALFWNPAGASATPGYEAVFSYGEYIADININYFAVTAPTGGIGTIGISAKVLDLGEWEETTESQPEGTGVMIDPNFWVLGLTYSRQMTDRVYFGSTFNYVSENVENTSANGFALDFGFQYVTPVQGLRFGVVLKSIGPDMRFDGADFERKLQFEEDDPNANPKPVRLVSASFELPSNIMFGVSYKALQTDMYSMNVSSDLQLNNHSDNEYRFGGEFAYKEMFFLRGGIIGCGQENYLFSGITFGAGVKVDLGGTALNFDYSYIPTDLFDNQNWFSVRLGF